MSDPFHIYHEVIWRLVIVHAGFFASLITVWRCRGGGLMLSHVCLVIKGPDSLTLIRLLEMIIDVHGRLCNVSRKGNCYWFQNRDLEYPGSPKMTSMIPLKFQLVRMRKMYLNFLSLALKKALTQQSDWARPGGRDPYLCEGTILMCFTWGSIHSLVVLLNSSRIVLPFSNIGIKIWVHDSQIDFDDCRGVTERFPHELEGHFHLCFIAISLIDY